MTGISCQFSTNKTEAISANSDFIVFTAELLQYSTESHEIKLLLKTTNPKGTVVWLLLQAHAHELCTQGPSLGQSRTPLVIFGCFL